MEFSQILLNKISYYLIDRNETISIAESVTSGSIQLAFSQMPDAQQFYKGGVTTYTIDAKIKHLEVDEKEAKATNCVSENITETMAINVAKLFDSDWSIACTGYATPVQQSNGEIFAYYCIAYKGNVILSDRIELHPLTKTMTAQNYFTECILSCLRCEVKKNLPESVM